MSTAVAHTETDVLGAQIDEMFRGSDTHPPMDTLSIASRLFMSEPAVVSCLSRYRNQQSVVRQVDGFWTKARVEDLLDRWAARQPVGMIAEALGTTRNAVLGKANRLGLPRMTDGAERPRYGVQPRIPPRLREDTPPMLSPRARAIGEDAEDHEPSDDELRRASASFVAALRRESGRAA